MQASLHFRAPSMLLSVAWRRADFKFGNILSAGKSLWPSRSSRKILSKSQNSLQYKKFSTSVIDESFMKSISTTGDNLANENDSTGVHARWDREFENIPATGDQKEYDEYPNIDSDWLKGNSVGDDPNVVYQEITERFSAPIHLAYEELLMQNDWEAEWVSREEMLKRSFLRETGHWRGLIRLPTGDTMQGEWKDGVLVGTGKLKIHQGSTYEGGYNGDHQRWKGKITFSNGNTQAGEWINGRPYGPFTATTTSGTEFEGTCTGDHSWEGRISHSSGEAYVGDFWHGYRHGHGALRNSRGHTYVGGWKMGERHGSGVLTARDSIYEGDFKHDKRHGQGVCKFPNGAFYEGEWAKGQMEGVGKLVGASGMTYEGEFVDSWRHGRGQVTYKDGSQYEGNFAYNLRCGQGTFTHFNGDVYSGEWLDDMKHGQGLWQFPDGSQLEGEFRYALPFNAHGTLKSRSGTTYEGTWVEGLREGPGRITYANGEFVEGEFRESYPWNAKGTFKPEGQTERLRGIWREGEMVTDFSAFRSAPQSRKKHKDRGGANQRSRSRRNSNYFD